MKEVIILKNKEDVEFFKAFNKFVLKKDAMYGIMQYNGKHNRLCAINGKATICYKFEKFGKRSYIFDVLQDKDWLIEFVDKTLIAYSFDDEYITDRFKIRMFPIENLLDSDGNYEELPNHKELSSWSGEQYKTLNPKFYYTLVLQFISQLTGKLFNPVYFSYITTIMNEFSRIYIPRNKNLIYRLENENGNLMMILYPYRWSSNEN